jgi:hypothetical protein
MSYKVTYIMISLNEKSTWNLWNIKWFYCVYSLYAKIFKIENSSVESKLKIILIIHHISVEAT